MGFIAAAIGLGVAGVGSVVSGLGASKSASAIADANASNSANENDLFTRQSDSLNNLIKRKNSKLKNISSIFDRFEGGGAFGDTDTLRNLRTAQQDFSALAAGDFSGFERQLQQSLQEALTTTQQSGAPVGTFAGLAADQQFQMRQSGLQTAMGISEFTSNESNKLLGMEFGIMDQKFNTAYQLDRTRVSNMNNYALGQAATEGVGLTAFGNAAQQIGSTAVSYGMYSQGSELQRQSLANQAAQIQAMSASAGGARPAINPYSGSFVPPASNNWNAPIPDYGDLPNGQPATILPGDPAYNNFADPWQGFDPWRVMQPQAGPGYFQAPVQTYTPDFSGDGSVLPPLAYNSILSQVGARIVA